MSAVMNAILELLPHHELTGFERVLIIYAFAAVGVICAVQTSQYVSDRPARWAVEHQHFWRTVHILLAWLCVQISYRHWLPLMQERNLCLGYEEDLLNFIWLGLLGLEAAMVLGGVVKAVVGGPSRPKVKEQ